MLRTLIKEIEDASEKWKGIPCFGISLSGSGTKTDIHGSMEQNREPRNPHP